MTQLMDYEWELQLPSNIDTEIAEGRNWEPVVTKWIESKLKDGDVAVDIGANIGWFTLLMARWVGSGRVIAFEPEPSFYARLLNHIYLNAVDNVELYPFAVSNKVEDAWCIKNAGPYFSSAHTVPSQPTKPCEATKVQCVSLDGWWEGRIDLIKIDVDGYERKVLRGAEETICIHKPAIAIEVADQETAAILEGWGYKLTWERNMRALTAEDVGRTLGGGLPTINLFAEHE